MQALSQACRLSACRSRPAADAARSIHPQRPRPSLRVLAQQGGMGDDEVDVAVFRFTLGIPGFDERTLPRVVGLTLGAMITLNHLATPPPIPGAQARAELLEALLAALCVLLPEIEERLRQALPGRGRQRGAEAVAGAVPGFFLADALDANSKQELAWASFVLLKNTNACGMLLLADGAALLARGAVAQAVLAPGNASATLAAAAQDVAAKAVGTSAQAVLSGSQQQLWMADRAAMARAGVDGWACVPAGVQSALLQAVGSDAPRAMLVLSERPRGLSDKDQRWVAALAAKLATGCPALATPAASS